MLPKKSGQDSESQHQLAERAQLARWATFSAIWEWDVEKKLFWSSPGNQLLFGRGDGEVTESFDPDDDEDPWGSRLHPDDRARVLQSVRDHLKNDAPYDLEYRYLLPDGEYKWVRSVGHAFRAPDGKPLRLIGMNIAISDPNLAEAKRETEAGLSAILENSPIAIIWKDVDGRYEYGNSVWLNRHGLTSAQIRGKTVQDFFRFHRT